MGHRIDAFRNLITALCFIVLIAMPMVLHLAKGSPTDSTVENRRLSPAPMLSDIASNWTGAPELANAWMRDHFGLRRAYLKLGFHLDTFLRSSAAFKAVRGDDGWLFNTLNGALALHQGLLPFAAGEADTWLDGLTQVQNAAEASGAEFVAMITPNKHSIYADYLTAYPRQAAGETRLGEVQRLAKERGAPLIDLTQVLSDAKSSEQVYFKTDSHWTDMGAYLGFTRLRSALAARGPAIPDIPRTALVPTKDNTFQGDLYRLLGEENGAPETVLTLTVDDEKIGPKAGSILFIGDSFAGRFLKYLEATFDTVTFIDNRAGEPDLAAIEPGKYDVVVYQVVERYLSRPFTPVAAQN